MPLRLRKFIGMVALVVLVVVYALVAMTIAAAKLPGLPALVQGAYYVVAGFLWVLPAGAIIAWMQKPARPGA
jgi:peptidoglycan/LPS O-acetylase OafA/YrhL